MSSLQVKSYLFPVDTLASVKSLDKATEIRRFAIDSSASYETLVQRIRLAYGNMVHESDELRTYWIDEENEMIGFATDAELEYATSSLAAKGQGQVFKVYITVNNKSDEASNIDMLPKPFGRHYEHGMRHFHNHQRHFQEHMKKHHHHHHPHPHPHNQNQNQTKSDSGDEKTPVVHLGIVCDGCQSKVVGIRQKCNECLDYDLCEACMKAEVHKETKHTFTKIERPVMPRCPFSGRRGPRCTRVINPNQAQQQQQHANSIQQAINQFMPMLQQNIPIVNDPEQLKNFGEYLKGFLDPFGIDVDYYVDNENKASSKQESEKKNENKDEKENTPAASASSSAVTVVKSEEAEQEKFEELIQLGEDLEKSSPFDEAAKALKKAIETKEKKESSVEPSVPEQDQANEENNFNLVDVEKELKIIKSIEQLRLMGYSDESGWLTRLATAKDGNINSILDALMPSSSKQ